MSDIDCWIDGSCGTLCSGIGYEITGDVEASGYRIIDDNITSMEAELHALLEAVRIASQESDDGSSITVYTDCRPLKRKVTASYEERVDWNEYRKSAQWLLNKFESWNVVHCSRTRTKQAHDLARLGLQKGREERKSSSHGMTGD